MTRKDATTKSFPSILTREDCQHLSSVSYFRIVRSLNGFVVLSESARQATSKDDADQLNQSDADADTSEKQRLVIEEIQELRQTSDFRCVVCCTVLDVLRQQVTLRKNFIH